jgi:hypothetical protein
MGRSSGSSNWFSKVAMFVAMVFVFGLPAIYWVCTKVLGVDVRSSVEQTYRRVFSHGVFESSPDSGSSDDGGD